jgi:hypothetical protein
MKHSSIVGGSSAERVINCPGSVKLVKSMNLIQGAKKNIYADIGTLCHKAMDMVLKGSKPEELLGLSYNSQVMTQELLKEKIYPALDALKEIGFDNRKTFISEVKVKFGRVLPRVFGTIDLIGKIDNKVVVLDWKFGDGVAVEAEENKQLMFYAAAAIRTKAWLFDGDDIECIIVQPPEIKRWVTNVVRIKRFEAELIQAVKQAKEKDAPLNIGGHCRWCAASPVCPKMTGTVDRALQLQLNSVDTKQLSEYLEKADVIEQWLADTRALAFTLLESGKEVPGYKLVAKRAIRLWTNEKNAVKTLSENGLSQEEIFPPKLISPAQAEKVLRLHGKKLPVDQVVAVSSGNTLVKVSDPRPEVVQIGQQLIAAFSKLK